MKLQHKTMTFDYSCKKLCGVLKIGQGYNDVESISLVILSLFGTSVRTDPDQITFKQVGNRKPITNVKFIDSRQGIQYDAKGNISGYWIDDHTVKTSWLLGEWRDRNDFVYAKVKITFHKNHATVDLYYTDIFVFQDILDHSEIKEFSRMRSLTLEGSNGEPEFYVDSCPVPRPLFITSMETYYAAQRFIPPLHTPEPRSFPQVVFVHKDTSYSMPYIRTTNYLK